MIPLADDDYDTVAGGDDDHDAVVAAAVDDFDTVGAVAAAVSWNLGVSYWPLVLLPLLPLILYFLCPGVLVLAAAADGPVFIALALV